VGWAWGSHACSAVWMRKTAFARPCMLCVNGAVRGYTGNACWVPLRDTAAALQGATLVFAVFETYFLSLQDYGWDVRAFFLFMIRVVEMVLRVKSVNASKLSWTCRYIIPLDLVRRCSPTSEGAEKV